MNCSKSCIRSGIRRGRCIRTTRSPQTSALPAVHGPRTSALPAVRGQAFWRTPQSADVRAPRGRLSTFLTGQAKAPKRHCSPCHVQKTKREGLRHCTNVPHGTALG